MLVVESVFFLGVAGRSLYPSKKTFDDSYQPLTNGMLVGSALSKELEHSFGLL
jgi:hypothetical protein